MIQRDLLLRCYEAALMPRWGEYPRTVELDELGRQGQVLQLAFVIAECRPDRDSAGWLRLIELAFIRFFRRIALTDIQAPVFDRLYGAQRETLNAYAHDELRDLMPGLPDGFPRRLEAYLKAPQTDARYAAERDVLDAASALVTQWELDIISPVNPESAALRETRRQVQALVDRAIGGEVSGEVSALLQNRALLEASGRLRIQRRWSRLPTLPSFNVAGHSFMVALLAWALCHESLTEHDCEQSLAPTVFGAVYHDIGEAFTRDVINPVKRGGGIENLLRQIELEALDEHLWPGLPGCAAGRLRHFAELEFDDEGSYCGSIIEASDKLAAMAEIHVTLENSVGSQQLRAILDATAEAYKWDFGTDLRDALVHL